MKFTFTKKATILNKKAFKIVDEMYLNDFEPWGQAVQTKNEIMSAGKDDEFDQLIEDIYPDGLRMVDVNDILAYDDNLMKQLGMVDKWEVDYDEYEDEEEARVAFEQAKIDEPEEDHTLYCNDEIVEDYKGVPAPEENDEDDIANEL